MKPHRCLCARRLEAPGKDRLPPPMYMLPADQITRTGLRG